MKRQLSLCLGVVVILLLSAYLGYTKGYSNGSVFAAQDKALRCQAALYLNSTVSLFKSEFMYEVVTNKDEWGDVILTDVAKENLQYHLKIYKDNYERLAPQLKPSFEKEHLENLKNIRINE